MGSIDEKIMMHRMDGMTSGRLGWGLAASWFCALLDRMRKEKLAQWVLVMLAFSVEAMCK